MFTQHSDRLEGWLNELSALPVAHRGLVAVALWQAGHDAAPEVLRLMSADSPVRQELLRLIDLPAQLVLDTPVRSASSLNLQRGAFLASGAERHILRIIEAAPGLDAPALGVFARIVEGHPRV